ncbi:MAG: family 16 glycosylhydrolase [Mangrovibacterium sp.]
MKQIFSVLAFFLAFACSDSDSSSSKDGVDLQIDLTPQMLSFTHVQGEQIIAVNADVEWGVSSSESWCKTAQSGGVSGAVNLVVKVEANAGGSARTAELLFKSGKATKVVEVYQEYKVEEVALADENFRAYCVNNFDLDEDGKFSTSEAASVEELNLSARSITSLAGLESFTALKKLNVSNNAIQVIDLQKVKLLENLDCSNNSLQALDIRINVNLNTLNCSGNDELAVVNVWTGFSPTSSFIIPDSASYVEPEISTPQGYMLVWNDEFNTARSTSGKAIMPDESIWWYETGASGWGNNEIQNYVAAYSGTDTCAIVSDGSLKIIAKAVSAGVYSIRMNTKESWTYGYFEARLKLPTGKGLWPAFWMMPQNFTAWPADGEIDIMEEVGYDPNRIHSSIHTTAYNHKDGTQRTATKMVSGAEGSFHVYAVEWTEDYVKGFVDGEEYFSFENDKKDNYDTWPFYKPFYLKLNLAWGGDWGGAQGIDENALPATYEIDYVRVFQK